MPPLAQSMGPSPQKTSYSDSALLIIIVLQDRPRSWEQIRFVCLVICFLGEI